MIAVVLVPECSARTYKGVKTFPWDRDDSAKK